MDGSADVTKITKTFLDQAIRESYRLNMRCQMGQDGKNRCGTSLSKFRFNSKELHPCIAISLEPLYFPEIAHWKLGITRGKKN